jgi:predicted metalloprotease with PDZ domain
MVAALRSLPLLLCAMIGQNVSAQITASPEPIRYVVRFPAPETNYVEVEAVYPASGRADVELMMAVWTPGSYLVREFSRNIESVSAHGPNGASLGFIKTRKNRWRVTTGGAPSVTVRYRVYAHEMSVRTNWVDAGFALLNGAPTFITLADRSITRRHDVRLELPAGWSRSVTALPPTASGQPHHYVAADFDTLVDSPILAGNPAVYEFVVSGKRHQLANEGEAGVWDGPGSARDVERIVRATATMWRSLPYDHYVFLNLLTEAGGGLEHKDSTVLMASRWATRNRESYLNWLGLVSHEFFHAWNVKRLRPIELGPFDYENEVYTSTLWVAEGFTSYYGDLLVRRADLSTDEEYLKGLSTIIKELQTTPGRLVQPSSTASYDAWIKHYRPDENSENVAISYYTKGAVIAFLLDAKIRASTGGRRSLDDVMRLAFERYAGAKGYSAEEFRRTASEMAGVDLTPWFRHAVDTTAELDYDEALEWLGLRFKPVDAASGGAWLGVKVRADNGRLIVSGVPRGTPAFTAGLNAEDEIIAIGGFRVPPDKEGVEKGLEKRLDRYRAGEQVELLVSRRGRVVPLEITLGREPQNSWQLEPRPDVTEEQRARRRAWLGGDGVGKAGTNEP